MSAGDTLVEDLPVADADGNGAGRAYTTVTLVWNLPPGDVLGYLHCTVRLVGGSVVFEGPITFAELADGVTFTVLGGTGRYGGFGGEW